MHLLYAYVTIVFMTLFTKALTNMMAAANTQGNIEEIPAACAVGSRMNDAGAVEAIISALCKVECSARRRVACCSDSMLCWAQLGVASLVAVT